MIPVKPRQLWKGILQNLTVIDKNIGVGVSITYDEEKVLHKEKLEPADWGD